jgi:hypothetical protein
MMTANMSVTKFADVTGIFLLKMPNNSHSNVPNANNEYIDNDMPEVSFVRIVFIACGRNEMVVQHAANKPSMVTGSIFIFYKVNVLYKICPYILDGRSNQKWQ